MLRRGDCTHHCRVLQVVHELATELLVKFKKLDEMTPIEMVRHLVLLFGLHPDLTIGW